MINPKRLLLIILAVGLGVLYTLQKNPSPDNSKEELSINKIENNRSPAPIVPQTNEPSDIAPIPDDISAAMGKKESNSPSDLPADLQAQLNAPPPELPEDLKKQLALPPQELPPDLKAQLNAPPPELPEDIKRALAAPPRTVTIEEVNNPPELQQ